MNKKVCMIAYTAYPFDARVRREAETLAAVGGFEVTVLCLKMATQARSYTLDGVVVQELDERKYAGVSKLRYVTAYLRFLVKAFLACSGLFIHRGIDVVHVHNMPNFLVLAGIIPKLMGRKVILDMHDSVPDTFASKFENGAGGLFELLCLEEKLSTWMSDRIICVNEVHRDVVVRRGLPAEKTFISMNVPDHRHFGAAARPQSALKQNAHFRLVYHGTIEERLGIDLAVEALAALKARIPGVELHLWGGRDYRHALREQSRQLGSGDIVHFHTAVPVDQLAHMLSGMDLGLVPYRQTAATDLALPVKMMEYIALGIPVVAPRLMAIERYFSDEMVSFFQPGNAESLVEAILRVYNDRPHRQARTEKAREFLDRYGWQKQAADFVRFYQRLQRHRH